MVLKTFSLIFITYYSILLLETLPLQFVLITGDFNAKSAKWWKNAQISNGAFQIESLISLLD